MTTAHIIRLRPRLPRLAAGCGRSRWIPYAFFGFFGVVIAVNMVMLAFALGTFNGLSHDGAYDRGLGYNRELAEFEAQRALGWHVDTSLTTDADGGRELAVVLVGRDGAPLTGAAVLATLMRPTQADMDRPVPLQEDRPGVFLGPADLPQPGQWIVRADIMRGDDSYRYERRITVR